MAASIISIVLIIILIVIFLHLFVQFFLSRLFIPYLGFRRRKLPKALPKGMLKTIEKIKKRSKTKKDVLINSADFLSEHYCGKFGKTWTCFSQMFITDIRCLWKMKGFLHCMHQNLLLRIFLIRSGMFAEKDIRINHLWFSFNIHQYLEINIAEKGDKINPLWVAVDLWSMSQGLKFGQKPPMLWWWREQ